MMKLSLQMMKCLCKMMTFSFKMMNCVFKRGQGRCTRTGIYAKMMILLLIFFCKMMMLY